MRVLLVNFAVTGKIQILQSKHSNKVYQIKKNLHCNSKIVAYLKECRVCSKQCNITTVTKFRVRANNLINRMFMLYIREGSLFIV